MGGLAPLIAISSAHHVDVDVHFAVGALGFWERECTEDFRRDPPFVAALGGSVPRIDHSGYNATCSVG